MNEKPVYLETWRASGFCGPEEHSVQVRVPGGVWTADARHEADMIRERLAAAAPALVRALLGVEHKGTDYEDCCPECGSSRHQAHKSCAIDAALTTAGFPDQASRDEARRRIAEAARA